MTGRAAPRADPGGSAPEGGLSVRALSRPGLQPVSLSIGRGECVALSGPSGSGKTLLLRAIADLDPNTGTVLLAGEDRGSMAAPGWRRRVIYVATEPGWWAQTVAEHFADWTAARELAPRLGLPEACGGWPVQRLSTGERQRLGLIRALVLKPAVLLLDEPTSALDPDAAAAVEAAIDRIRARDGTAVLWVTHDGGQAMRVAGRRLTMEGGRCQ